MRNDNGMTPGVAPSAYMEPDALIALVGAEWADWYRLSPQDRWRETEQLWRTFTDLGGSLDVEPGVPPARWRIVSKSRVHFTYRS